MGSIHSAIIDESEIQYRGMTDFLLFGMLAHRGLVKEASLEDYTDAYIDRLCCKCCCKTKDVIRDGVKAELVYKCVKYGVTIT